MGLAVPPGKMNQSDLPCLPRRAVHMGFKKVTVRVRDGFGWFKLNKSLNKFRRGGLICGAGVLVPSRGKCLRRNSCALPTHSLKRDRGWCEGRGWVGGLGLGLGFVSASEV